MGSVADRTLQSAFVWGLRRGARVRWRAIDTRYAPWFLRRWVLREARFYRFLIIFAPFATAAFERPQIGVA
jgi:hypothetical protein